MTWIALVGPEIEENLSLRYLVSALATKGHEARILPFAAERDFPRVASAILRDDPPFLVGLSLAFQIRAPDTLALAVALREAGYQGHITAGGHFATFACRELLRDFPEIDTICRQEAEETLPALVRVVLGGAKATALRQIPGLAFRDDDETVELTCLPPVPELAGMPWPDRRGDRTLCLSRRQLLPAPQGPEP